jgi:hypothetical protein
VTSVFEFTVWDSFLTILWFFLFVIWIWLLFTVFSDIFRSHDLNGWSKALWALFVFAFPYLGVFVYLIARGGKMQERAATQAAQREAAFRDRVQQAASTDGGAGTNAADQIAQLAALRDAGTLSDAEFQQAKAKVLA